MQPTAYQRVIATREHGTSKSMFAVAQCMNEGFWTFIQSIVYVLIMYWMVSFYPDFGKVWWCFFLDVFLCICVGVSVWVYLSVLVCVFVHTDIRVNALVYTHTHLHTPRYTDTLVFRLLLAHLLVLYAPGYELFQHVSLPPWGLCGGWGGVHVLGYAGWLPHTMAGMCGGAFKCGCGGVGVCVYVGVRVCG